MSTLSSSPIILSEEASKIGFFKRLQKTIFSIGIEIILPLTLISLLSIIFDDGRRFIQVSPHPFWIVLLLVTVQHGTQRGFMCAALCSLFLLVGNIPPQTVSQTLYDYFFHLMYNPILWFLSSFVLGELRIRHIQENKEFSHQTKRAQQETLVFQKAFQNLKKIKEALEIRITAELRTPATILRTIEGIIETSPEKVIENFIKALETLVSPEHFSIFVLEEKTLDLAHTHGWPLHPPYITRFTESSPLFQHIVVQKKEACVITSGEEKILSGQGVYAFPLLDPRTQEVFGMVKFEKLPFKDLNLSTLETTRALTRCTCKAYVLALEIMNARAA